MKNQFLTHLASFILGCVSGFLLIGYISLWVNYPPLALIATLVCILALLCAMYCRVSRRTYLEHDSEESGQ